MTVSSRERVGSASGRIALVAVLMIAEVLVLTGCGLNFLQPGEADIQTYVLDARLPPRRVPQSSDKILLVPLPKAQPGFDSPFIAYTKNPLELDYYTKSKWADTPARMLAPLVVQALEDTHAFKAVVMPPTPVDGDLRLEMDIIRLQQEFWEYPSRVRLTVRAKLFDVETRHVLGTQLFEIVEKAPAENALGGVQAANTAVNNLLMDLRDFVQRHVSG